MVRDGYYYGFSFLLIAGVVRYFTLGALRPFSLMLVPHPGSSRGILSLVLSRPRA